jgi:hypothetical protein
MKIGNGFKTRLEFVLEQVFEGLSGGGDHDMRAFVAARLLAAAQSGILKLEDLKRVAQEALFELLQPPKPAQLQHRHLDQSSFD